jgi:hypothetical protein
MENKSQVYGYYGGVRTQNLYTPPASTPFVPQPAKAPFYSSYAEALEPFTTLNDTTITFISSVQPYLMRRYLESRVNQTESYMINTAINPNNQLTYETGLSGAENLLRMDGGFI